MDTNRSLFRCNDDDGHEGGLKMPRHTKEEIVGVWSVSAYPEDFNKVIKLARSKCVSKDKFTSIELTHDATRNKGRSRTGGRDRFSPMDVTDDGDGNADMDDVGLFHQYLLCLFTNFP